MYVAPRPKASDDPYFAVRLSLGCIVAVVVAVLIQSKMPMLIPALTVGLMGGMRKSFDLAKAIGGPLVLIVSISVFYLLISLVHVMPAIELVVVFSLGCLAYYIILRTGNPVGMLLLISITLMSVMGAKSFQAMVIIKDAFIEGALTALLVIPVLYWLLPSVAKTPLAEEYRPDPHGYHWQRAAIRSLVMLLLLAWLYTVLDTSNMILAMAAVFALVFPSRQQQFAEAKERSYATFIGGMLALTILSLTTWVGHLSILLALLFLAGLFLGDRMMHGSHPPMVYQFAFSVLIALTIGSFTNQEPVSSTFLRITLTLIGAISAAYLSALLELLLLPKLQIPADLAKNPD